MQTKTRLEVGGVRELFPYVVCRVCNLPFDELRTLRFSRSTALLSGLVSVESRLRQQQTALSCLLSDIVKRTEHRAGRGVLLSLRRSIFNGRLPKDEEWVKWLPPTTLEVVGAWQASLVQLSRLQREYESTYCVELAEKEHDVFRLAADEDFRRALAVSSPALFDALEHPRQGSATTARRQRVIRSLLRYLCRMAVRPTPFGRFVDVVGGAWQPDGAPISICSGAGVERRSIVRLNKALLHLFALRLIAARAFRVELPVEPNPTLRMESRDFVFSTVTPLGREIVRRTRISSIAGSVLSSIQTYRAANGHFPSYGTLWASLRATPSLQRSRIDLDEALQNLLQAGILQAHLGIPDQEEGWVDLLLEKLSAYEDAEVRTIADALREASWLAQCSAAASARDRRRLQRELAGTLSVLLTGPGSPADPSGDPTERAPTELPDNLLYEDSTRSSDVRLSAGRTAHALADLLDCVRRLSAMGAHRQRHAALRRRFERHYHAGIIPLVRFYNEVWLPSVMNGAADEPQDYDCRYSQARRLLTRRLQVLCNEADRDSEVVLQDTDIEVAVREAELERPARTPCSASVFLQFLADGRLVVPSGAHTIGFGKYFSRFLNLLDPSVTSTLRVRNASFSQGNLADICSDAHFNANLHPRLTEWDIVLSRLSDGDRSRQMLWNDLSVGRDERDPERLCVLRHDGGDVVVPVDLGFQNPGLRSPLYEMLSVLGPSVGGRIELPLPWTATQDSGPEGPLGSAILGRPRITYRGTVIIGRRTWFVPAAVMPTPDPGESDAQYFARVNRWRREDGIPAEALICPRWRRLQQMHDGREIDATPQFVDFESGLLMAVWKGILSSIQGADEAYLEIEELLPAYDDMVLCDGKRYVAQAIAQLDVDVPSA